LGNDNADRLLKELFSAARACISQQQSGRTISKTKASPVRTTLFEIHQNICSPAVYDIASRTHFLRCLSFSYKSELSFKKKKQKKVL